jgi:hypothetical protein
LAFRKLRQILPYFARVATRVLTLVLICRQVFADLPRDDPGLAITAQCAHPELFRGYLEEKYPNEVFADWLGGRIAGESRPIAVYGLGFRLSQGLKGRDAEVPGTLAA